MDHFENTVKEAVPGGSLAKPILIALGALLLKKVLTRDSAPAPQPAPAPVPTHPPASGGSGGGLLDGLGDLISKFEKAGHRNTIDSWIGRGPNQPIQPGQLQNTLGQTTISELARQAGISEQELLDHLARSLPGAVDKLTPQGRLPTLAEITVR
jgi:uncharacterized protein YidB (DUF937 family)